ncbi:hypothetical protein ATEIFO6365_0007010700 [Aspergillus terreus]|uniref:Uncharacterized protein n=1 Tax=Aspergillus terreus TaxID=33178 RepID=A0A5M3Z434_ASPTE|nr:hypothetical protein ATETN484_0009010700 [Aspergillus terreus]GFF17558.1 hypothetical protein ATEIFO6365_0007010700 [Aspergillus terreus]
MRVTSTLLILAAAMGAIAAPNAEPVQLEARDERISVDICSGTNLGNCINIGIYTQHQCYNLNGSPVNDNVKSVRIPNGYRCRFWDSTKCNGGGTGDIQAPGNNNINGGSLSSIKCYKN